MLPELTEHGAAALTSSKYFGKNGLDALSAILQHADRYGLKWVFVKDPYYEPLLVFSGWRKVDDLENRTITIWTREAVPPATPIDSPQRPLAWEGVLWGILPMASSLLAIALVLIPNRRLADADEKIADSAAASANREDLVFGRMTS